MSSNTQIHTVFLESKGYVLSYDVSPHGLRSNYRFDRGRAALLSELEAREVVKDLAGAVVRPMVVKPQETPN